MLGNNLARFEIPNDNAAFVKHESCEVLSILVKRKAVRHRPQAAQGDLFRVAQVLQVIPLPAAQIALSAVQQVFALHDVRIGPFLLGEGNCAGIRDSLSELLRLT